MLRAQHTSVVNLGRYKNDKNGNSVKCTEKFIDGMHVWVLEKSVSFHRVGLGGSRCTHRRRSLSVQAELHAYFSSKFYILLLKLFAKTKDNTAMTFSTCVGVRARYCLCLCWIEFSNGYNNVEWHPAWQHECSSEPRKTQQYEWMEQF